MQFQKLKCPEEHIILTGVKVKHGVQHTNKTDVESKSHKIFTGKLQLFMKCSTRHSI